MSELSAEELLRRSHGLGMEVSEVTFTEALRPEHWLFSKGSLFVRPEQREVVTELWPDATEAGLIGLRTIPVECWPL